MLTYTIGIRASRPNAVACVRYSQVCVTRRTGGDGPERRRHRHGSHQYRKPVSASIASASPLRSLISVDAVRPNSP